MSGTFELDNQLFPTDPISKRWSRQEAGKGANRVPVFSSVWSLSLRFPTLESRTQANFFESRYMAGGLYNLKAPSPHDGTLTTYTGVAIESFEYTTNDIESQAWVVSPTLIFSVDISATGTV